MKALFSSTRSSETDASSGRSSSSASTPPQQLPEGAGVDDLHGDALAFAATFLSDPQKRGLVGLCACLLPRVHDGSHERQWSATYLTLLVEYFLALPKTQADAYVPMLTATDHYGDVVDGGSDDKGGMNPAPFLELLDDDPKGANGFRRSWGDSHEYLRAFYRSHNSEKVDQVDQVLERYKGREDEFFGILRRTYSIHDGTTTQDPLRMLAESRAATYGSAGSEANTPEAMRAWRWKDRFQQGDQYVLMWEEALLRKFGRSMRSFAREQVMTYANAEIVKYTALATLFAAVAIPRTILRLADMIDNVWVLAMNAADASGKLLAQSLQRREQGLRPVTLVGYGMGARLIFACLKELAKTPDECCGIVENAVLLGSPVPVVNQDWQNARRVVSGRLINGYSENDWMLGVMYRYQGWALNSAGIAAIDVRGVENANLSSIINGHMEYKNKIGVIMDVVNLD
uniref:DUF726 domain-containing protein n=1 Tax=Globisporangium ultimum (strain ATCC 200006 / CBS 805.95 / DAOM BR144) TaxID=431595 RepID=K3WME1_GLOUD